MPEKTAIKVNNYAVMPISILLAASTVALLFLKAFSVISVPWWVVFSPIAMWLGVVIAAGLVVVVVISLIALVQIWR